MEKIRLFLENKIVGSVLLFGFIIAPLLYIGKDMWDFRVGKVPLTFFFFLFIAIIVSMKLIIGWIKDRRLRMIILLAFSSISFFLLSFGIENIQNALESILKNLKTYTLVLAGSHTLALSTLFIFKGNEE